MPTLPLRKYFPSEPFVAAQSVRLGKGHEVLMTIQFPCDFAVAHFREVEIFDPMKRLVGRDFPVDRVQVPIDLRAVVERLVPEEIEAVRTNFICALNDF